MAHHGESRTTAHRDVVKVAHRRQVLAMRALWGQGPAVAWVVVVLLRVVVVMLLLSLKVLLLSLEILRR